MEELPNELLEKFLTTLTKMKRNQSERYVQNGME